MGRGVQAEELHKATNTIKQVKWEGLDHRCHPSITLQVVGGDTHFVSSESPTMSRNSTWAAVVTSRQQICEVVPFWREHDCIEVEWWRPWGLVDMRRARPDASSL